MVPSSIGQDTWFSSSKEGFDSPRDRHDMSYYVYLIHSIGSKKNKSYVGYTMDLKKRINLHNNNKGAKATRGYKWKIIFKKKFILKSEAMIYEYSLKKNRSLRKMIIAKSNIILKT